MEVKRVPFDPPKQNMKNFFFETFHAATKTPLFIYAKNISTSILFLTTKEIYIDNDDDDDDDDDVDAQKRMEKG